MVPEQPSPWRHPDYVPVFLSHSNEGKETATDLKSQLADYYIEAFVAHEDIEPASQWVDVIEHALQSCEALVALVTSDFSASDWTDQEVGYCLGRNTLVLPVRLGHDPYGFVGRYQAIPGLNMPAEELATSIWDVLVASAISIRMVEAFVTAFERSDSYVTSLKLARGLNKVPTFTSDQLTRLSRAQEINSNVSGAYGVREKIAEVARTAQEDARSVSSGTGQAVSPSERLILVTPVSGVTVKSPFEVRGYANAMEGNIIVETKDASGEWYVITNTMAALGAEGQLFRFQTEVALDPGSYPIRVCAEPFMADERQYGDCVEVAITVI